MDWCILTICRRRPSERAVGTIDGCIGRHWWTDADDLIGLEIPELIEPLVSGRGFNT